MDSGMTENMTWPTGVSRDGRSEGYVDKELVVVGSSGALLWNRKSRRRPVGDSLWAVGVGDGGTGVQVGRDSNLGAVLDCVRCKHGEEVTAGSMAKVGDGSSPW